MIVQSNWYLPVEFYSGAEFDSDSDENKFVTHKENGVASLNLTLTGKVNSLVCSRVLTHSLSLSLSLTSQQSFSLQGHHMLNFNFSQERDEDLICPTQSLVSKDEHT